MAFPSLTIRKHSLEPEGSFAEAQAEYLEPDPASVAELDELLRRTNTGVVAHYYMDAELQGVLSSCSWPHIEIADSLKMAGAANAMAAGGVQNFVVLGVDFMSENVRALLDDGGFAERPVYRVSSGEIGCSLAEAAERPAYEAYLREAAKSERPLHVVYINTSLRTKALAHTIVPTITCTSSNVLQTVLQAASEIEGVEIFFGPDTYMGENLARMLEHLCELDDETISRVHSAHDTASIRALRERFHYFRQGNCIVHHMFGARVVRKLREEHQGALLTAHLEVPGEMFELALEAQRAGRGVVGSTSNILSFIKEKAAKHQGDDKPIEIVLGTESGMITSIVRSTQSVLEKDHPGVRVIFPVAEAAISQTEDTELGVVPGVSGGEGCSTAGGCATCPYMKINSLDALLGVLESISGDQKRQLSTFHPKKYVEQLEGRSLAQLGGEPILAMQHFQKSGVMKPALLSRVTAPAASPA